MNMKRILFLLMALCMVMTLTGCQSGEIAESGKTVEQVVNVFNWEDYIDPEVLDLFEQETGIKVNYMCFTTVEDMIVQVEANPGAFDVCFPSDYIIERMINKGMLAEINYQNVPNADPNADTCQTLDHLLYPDYDPENKYSVPYMWGTVGILYNTTMIDLDPETTSWSILWDPQYQNSIFMMDSIRDSMGIALKYLGHSVNSRDIIALETAKAKLIEQKQSGMVKAYQVDETKDKMVAGEAALALVWSGDAQYAIDLNPDLAYAVPMEGSNIWVDPVVILKGAKNMENAEKFINFLCRPDIAQMNCEAIWYSSPNAGAIELMGEAYTSNPVMNPSDDVTARCEFFNDIDEMFMPIYNALWQEVKNAK